MRSHLVVLTSEMYVSNTWHLTLELSLKLYRVKDYRLYEVWHLLTSLFYYAGYIFSLNEPTEKKHPKPFVQAQRAKVKKLSVSVTLKDWPDSMASTLEQIDDVKNIRSAGTFRPDKAASPKDVSTRSTLCL